MNKWLFILLAVLFPYSIQASLQDDMQHFFDQIGAHANVTPGGAYKGQEGGFYTGGSLFARTPAREIQMLNIQMPNIGAGCNGIDLFTGGVGFIDARRFVETLKAIGANAAGYTFSLATKQISPQIMNQIEEMLSMANNANWNNINSCQMGMNLVNNTAASFHEGSVRTCIQTQLKKGVSKDYIEARDHCKSQANVNAQNKAALSDNELKDSTLHDLNIVWRAIQNNGALANLSDDLKYYLMSLTGTIIIRSNPNGSQKQIYLSKLYSDDLFAEKAVKVYACADKHDTANGCLTLQDKTVQLSGSQGFMGRVRQILKTMEQKVEDDEPLTEPEKQFLESTALPVYKMLNVHSAFGRGASLLLPTEYSEVIAMDILYRYVDTGISDVMKAYQNNLLPENLHNEFLKMIELARTRIKDLRSQHLKKMVQTQDLIAKVQMMEKQVSSLISSDHFNNLPDDFGG
jgi:conjugative transfer pilus assembly protein TraH